jgi:hypothetical protein
MPNIPYKRQRSLTGESPTALLPHDTGTGAAIADFGRAVVGFSDVLLQRREQQRRQDRDNKSIEIGANYDDQQRAFLNDELEKKGSDSYGSIERAEEFRKSSLESFTSGIEDEVLKESIKRRITTRTGSMMDSLSRYQSNQREEVSRFARERSIDGIVKDSYEGIEPIEDSLERWYDTVSLQRESGLLGEEEAIDLIVKGSQGIAESSLDGIVNRDPKIAVELINAGVYDQLLPKEKIAEFDKKAIQLQAAIDKDTIAQQKERERKASEALKEQQGEVYEDFLENNVEGILTREQVFKSILEPKEKEHFIKEIEQREEKASKEGSDEWKTKPEIEADLISRITDNPESVKDKEITGKQGKGLDTNTAKQLLSFKQKRLKGDFDPVKEQEMKTAIKRLSDAKTARYFDPASTKEGRINNSKLWAENVNNLQRYIRNHPDEDIALYVDQILEPAEQSWGQHIVDILSFGQPGREEAVEIKQEELKIEAGGVNAGNRDRAIGLLNDNGLVVNEETIKQVMDQF